MALLHCDGFDGRTMDLPGAYTNAITGGGSAYGVGRFGTGSCRTGWAGVGGQMTVTKPFPAARATVISGVALKNFDAYNFQESVLLDFYSGGTSVLTLRINPTNHATAPGGLRVARGPFSAAGTTLGTLPAGTVPSGGVWIHLEMKVVCGTGTAGTVTLRRNGAVILTIPGVDTGSATLDALALALKYGGPANQGGWEASVDDWWVCDGLGTANNDFLGDLRVLTLVPVGAGSSTQLTPSAAPNWGCVDEIPPTIADHVGHATVGNKDLYDLAALSPAYSVRGVRAVGYVLASDAGAKKGRLLCKSGATTGTGSDVTLTTTAQVTSTIFETDPAAGMWTPANLNAAEFGWEVRI
jgi:hypothetical protein